MHQRKRRTLSLKNQRLPAVSGSPRASVGGRWLPPPRRRRGAPRTGEEAWRRGRRSRCAQHLRLRLQGAPLVLQAKMKERVEDTERDKRRPNRRAPSLPNRVSPPPNRAVRVAGVEVVEPARACVTVAGRRRRRRERRRQLAQPRPQDQRRGAARLRQRWGLGFHQMRVGWLPSPRRDPVPPTAVPLSAAGTVESPDDGGGEPRRPRAFWWIR